ncbi:MAG: PEP/pyruvate-binding domain-containing protein, partial [Streptosporangiaceae bacterium]
MLQYVKVFTLMDAAPEEVFVAAELVMALDDPAAEVAAVGGKGASLARLARAGLRVPPGFHLTTRAYLEFTAHSGLREQVLAAVSGAGDAGPDVLESMAQRVGELFAATPVPPDVTAAVAGAYAGLGHDVAVAVRSSATTEDLADLSFAGQHATYLNVRGETAVLDAVKRCWASLWTSRAIDYRARHGVATAQASMAVVVQRLVPADAAGVLFTVDPVGGGCDQVVINASWGLG